ncbi:MAG: efflux RND transporter periplasmic adaptor subunit, partial [Gemmatimonadaceae bacterium]
LYSPDLVVAEDELIAARQSVDALSGASAAVRMQAQSLVDSARRKLQLLDIPDAMINTIAKQEHAAKNITIRSPAEGVLEDKMIVQGSSVQAGMKLMRIEDHRTMWLEAQAYEEQLPRVKLGDMADATLDALPGKTFSGKIIFINPHLNHMTRTIDVRVALDNPQFVLKPGMYATVLIHSKPVDDAILVPREAVIDTGTRKIAFIAEGDGHFSPRLVTTGLAGDHDEVQILSGLAPGEAVVTSGQFLMDVESRTEEAIEKMRTPVQPPQTEPSNTMPATTTFGGAATGAAETGPGTSTGRLDAVTRTYLTVVDYLQADHTDNKPVDIAKLLDAAQQLVKEVPADPENQRTNTLLNAVSAMKDQSLDAQRKRFETVSSAMVGLIDIEPPSKAVAATLYVVHCPMEKADWLQTQRAVNNPFLATMRTCGAVTRTISLMPTK